MNITYKISDINESDLLNVLKLWNDEKGDIYPFPKKAFYQNVINYADKDVMIAYCDNKTVGFIILKRFDDNSLVDYTNDLFISLFFVSKKYRKNGIGTRLFEFAEEKRNGRNLVVGKDIYNFFPGVPTEFDNLTDVWLEKRGFTGTRYTHDLIAYKPKFFKLRNENVIYQYCKEDRKDELIQFIMKNNWKRWALEVKMYFENKTKNDEDAYLIGLIDNKIVSFLRINTAKMDIVSYNVLFQERFSLLGGIGPLGVDKDCRKNGLGMDMMSKGIECLIKKNVTEIMLDWTGLMEIYDRFGFEVWKSYKYMYKQS